MNSIFIIRIILIVIFIAIVSVLLRIHSAIEKERRIARYSLKMNDNSEDSYLDKLYDKYYMLMKRFKDNKMLIKESDKYKKYVYYGDAINEFQIVINKLLVACIFVCLVIISYAIKGKLVGFFGFILSFIIGYFIYDIYLFIANKRKIKKIKNDMLRSVIIMNNAFKAGKSTLQAVHIASLDLPKPISLEFNKIYQDMSYGLSADIAFMRFAKRVKLEEANYIASSLTVLNKTGGNIINVFSSIEKTLFDKKKLESELENSTAASKLVVIVLMIMPIVFVLGICLFSPDYFNPLFTSILGYFILFVILIMFIVYVYLLSKIMKVKV